MSTPSSSSSLRLAKASGMGFKVPGGVALALKEPRQDVLGQRVGAQDGYYCGGCAPWGCHLVGSRSLSITREGRALRPRPSLVMVWFTSSLPYASAG